MVTTKTAQPVAAGASPRDAGDSFLRVQIEAVEQLTAQVGRSNLTRRMTTQDVLRGRTTSAARIGEAIADATVHGADPVHVLAAGERISAWFRRLVEPSAVSLEEACDRETLQQARAGLAQRRAYGSKDPALVRLAMLETEAHLGAAQQLLDSLARKHAMLTQPTTGRCG
jgi:hypothetical protein